MCKGLPEAVTTSRLQAVSAACDVQSGSQTAIRLSCYSCAPIFEGAIDIGTVLGTA